MTDDDIESRVETLMREGRWRTTIALIEAVPVEHRSSRLNWGHGWAHYKLNKFERAAASLRRAVLREPGAVINHWALGVVLRESGDLAGAEKHLLQALSIRDSGLARLNLSLVYMDQDRLDEAERVHLEGILRKPWRFERLEAYGDFLTDCGRDDDAAVIYAEAKKHIERQSP